MPSLRLFSYKMTTDSGFAPNPFWGALTLATCKPQIRLHKDKGDWIAGFTSQGLCGDAVGNERLIFLAEVTEPKITIADYFRSGRFEAKKPIVDGESACVTRGDNIYEPLMKTPTEARHFRQLENESHWDGEERSCGACAPGPSREHDLSGQFVLVSMNFVYFGRAAIVIPQIIRPTVPQGQSAHGTSTRDEARVKKFIDFVFGKAGGKTIVAQPHDWPEEDDCWKNGDRPRGGPLSSTGRMKLKACKSC